ncbi:hypothetical protein MMYC01_203273 [Madurella mycetomatis]|uniref:Uncharacterized protein n=1 Tax=Madurella mycetomatis TaxID=100816 RepID=A0A175W9L9_9PEZI|nr:hypothetical protein MMYC01_203273 [Madurella mycetomatis]
MASLPKNMFPGLGLPVEHLGDKAFPLAVDRSWASNGVTLREKRMLDFIGKITDKPGWEVKVFDQDIVSRWRAEADVRLPEFDGDVYLSQDMFNFCIAELRDKSEHFKKTGRVNVLDSEIAIVKSDNAISKELQNELRAGVKVLEDVPEQQKDWHPDSDEMVLDLVHPSLFPVVWGLTRALEEGTVPLDGCIKYIGKGVTVASLKPANDTPVHDSPSRLWGSFQWLPAQVELTEDGAAKITSYINNLHPGAHKNLYSVLERIVAATVPLWEDCLSGFVDRLRIDLGFTGSDDYTYPPGLKYHIPGRAGPKSVWDPITDTYDGVEGEDEDEDDDGWRYDDDFYFWKHQNRVLMYREPREYISQAELASGDNRWNRVKLIYENDHKPLNLRERFPAGIQVIFKLANIHLTPEKPVYSGGTWHVEGTLNEMICASAIYYYDQDNITDSFLAFRQALDDEEITAIPEQNEHQSLEAYLGITQGGPAVQELGKVLTRESRLLVFPNCVQHQVQPFELQDKAKPGHRKILAMFLIDPQRPILSSAHVPPQRRDWWAQELSKDGGLDKLPPEIFNMTVDMVDDFPISWEQAVEFRESLMEERSGFNEAIDDHMAEQYFNFCEH